ncbi:hypothetical protein D9M69_261720 [compost metagenome]
MQGDSLGQRVFQTVLLLDQRAALRFVQQRRTEGGDIGERTLLQRLFPGGLLLGQALPGLLQMLDQRTLAAGQFGGLLPRCGYLLRAFRQRFLRSGMFRQGGKRLAAERLPLRLPVFRKRPGFAQRSLGVAFGGRQLLAARLRLLPVAPFAFAFGQPDGVVFRHRVTQSGQGFAEFVLLAELFGLLLLGAQVQFLLALLFVVQVELLEFQRFRGLVSGFFLLLTQLAGLLQGGLAGFQIVQGALQVDEALFVLLARGGQGSGIGQLQAQFGALLLPEIVLFPMRRPGDVEQVPVLFDALGQGRDFLGQLLPGLGQLFQGLTQPVASRARFRDIQRLVFGDRRVFVGTA